jgi:FK506-binding protein 2
MTMTMTMTMTTTTTTTTMTVPLLALLCLACIFTSYSLSSNGLPKKTYNPDRRAALSTLATCPSLFLGSPVFASVAGPPLPQAITTVILDSPGVSAGLKLYDVKIGSTSYAAVQSVKRDGTAASSGVQEGMILLGKDKTAGSVVGRIKNGPYPIVLQFYNLAEDAPKSPTEALVTAQIKAEEKANVKEPPLSAKGTGLIVKTTKKGENCKVGSRLNARSGDSLQINYEARVASPGGPIYDSTEQRGRPVEFVLGRNEAIKGVDVGLYDMCVGEVRELDIPNLLGYGPAGSQILDVPGEVRLWWKVELLKVTKSDKPAIF